MSVTRRTRTARLGTIVPLTATVLAVTALAVATPAPSPADAQPSPTVRLELEHQELAFRPGETLRLAYRITGDLAALSITPDSTGPSVTAPPDGAGPDGTAAPEDTILGDTDPGDPAGADAPPAPPELVVQVTNYPPLTAGDSVSDLVGSDVDRSAFGTALDGIEVRTARASMDVAPGDDEAGFEVVVPTDTGESVADRLRFDDPGIHPLRIELLATDATGGRTVVATAGTVVQRLPAVGDPPGGAPVDLAVVTAVDQLPAVPTDAEVAAARAALDDAVAFAADVSTPVAAALPPDLLAREAEDRRPDLVAALADDELVSLPAAPLDVSSAAAVDRVDAFARLLTAGEDLLTAAVPTTPTRRDLWIATGPLSAEGAQVLRDLGTRFVVMAPDLYDATVPGPRPATDRFVAIALPDGGTLPLLVVDDVGATLTAGSLPPDTTTTELAVETVAGVLLGNGGGDGSAEPGPDGAPPPARSRIVAAPGFGPLDPVLVDAVAAMAQSTPDVRFAVASTLVGLTDVQQVAGRPLVVDLPSQAGPELDARVERLDGAGLAMVSAASMLPEGDPRRTDWANELDSLISTAYDDEDVEQRVGSLLDEADRLKSAVVPPEPFTFTLTGRTGEIEIPIGNDLSEPLRVVLHLQSPKLVFPEGDTEVVLDPDTETRVTVPVRARANGTSSVSVDIRTPLGEDVTETVRLTSRVNALTGIGQVVTGGLVVVLLTWWFTHWRSRRRQEALRSAERHPSRAG